MKKYIIKRCSQMALVAFAFTTLTTISCTNLDEDVYSELTSENFDPTENDLLALTISGYTPLRLLFAGNNRWLDLQEETGNCLITATRSTGGWDDGGMYKRNHFHDWTSELPQLKSTWDKVYEGISKCNQILYQIDSGFVPVASGKENTEAELKSLRAIYYYVLLDLFGNVPLVTSFSDISLPETTPRKKIFEFVEKELTESLPYLNSVDGTSSYARVTQSVARAILVRIYLNAKVYTGEERYDDCIEQCDELMKKSYLLEGYLDPFKYNNENSKENIFVVQCDDKFATGSAQFLKFFHNLSSKVYQMTPQAWNGSFLSPQFYYSYRQGDLRKEWTWLQGEQKDPNGNVIFTYYNDVNDMYYAKPFSGYRPGKYLPRLGLAAGAMSNDWVVIRYAEVLYSKAECLLRKGGAGNEAEAARLVSLVRERSFKTKTEATITADFLKAPSNYPWGIYVREKQGVDANDYVEEVYTPGDPLPATITERQNSNDIQFGGMLDEWLWEFAMEGQNRMHLIRFGAFTTKKWFNHRPNDKMGENITLFAIPQHALDKNSLLKKNPGY